MSEEITPSNHSLQNNQQVNRGAKTSELGILIDAEDRKKGKDWCTHYRYILSML